MSKQRNFKRKQKPSSCSNTHTQKMGNQKVLILIIKYKPWGWPCGLVVKFSALCFGGLDLVPGYGPTPFTCQLAMLWWQLTQKKKKSGSRC